jgi:hypothetical protein
MPGKEIHFTISPHLNHRHVKEFLFAGPHFFDVQFPGRFKIGITPDVNLAIGASKKDEPPSKFASHALASELAPNFIRLLGSR